MGNLHGINDAIKVTLFDVITRLEAIRIFLVYAAYMGFVVYKIDANSAFLNGKLSKEVYVQHPHGFESSEFRNYVCKLEKALYELKLTPRAWYETLSKFLIKHKFVRDLLKKYELADYASVKCPMLPPNNLGPDESGVSINETQFRCMIGSLMVWKSVGYGVSKSWIRRIEDFLEHGYAVSSLMDTTYWSLE
ncbi:retrovirus-related pol polyprotein from transposon TNT 1-94 [Tanacetum coccineum]